MVRVLVALETVMVELLPSVTAPAPKFKLCVPVKVKLFMDIAGAGFKVKEPALELSITVPDAIVKVPAVPPLPPKAAALPTFNVPALCDTPPVKVFAPDKIKVPEDPAFVKLKEPPIIPPKVNVLAEQVIVLLAVRVFAPVLCVKANEPAKVKSPPIDIGLVIVLIAVTSRVPPEIVKVPVPRAASLPMFKVPAFKLTPPVKVLAPFNVIAAVPAFVIE